MSIRAWLGLGTNLGDREANLREAEGRLREFLENFRISKSIESAAVDSEGRPDRKSPSYLNAAAVGDFPGTPRQLLARLQDIELAMGRPLEEKSKYLPRLIDLDILLLELNGRPILIHEDGLIVPHPRMKERSFVMEPLRDLSAC